MAAPIRPGHLPVPAAPPPKPAAVAAQRAFFQAALAQGGPAAESPAASAAPAARVAAVRAVEAAERPTRPGSLLDIRV